MASHDNNLDERGVASRKESRIYHLRNLNNWIKSQLINEYMDRVKAKRREEGSREPITVLDMGCGKGGDLLKWQKAGADHVVCADIAATSVEQCEARYRDMARRGVRESGVRRGVGLRCEYRISLQMLQKEDLISKWRKYLLEYSLHR